MTHTLLATFHAMVHGFDVIHFHSIGPSLLAFLPRLLCRAKVVVTFHSIDREHGKWGWFARTVLTIAEWAAVTFPDETIVVSRHIADYCHVRYGANVTVIPNGASIAPVHSSSLIQSSLGLHKDKYILVMSRLIPHKNIHLVIEAFKRTATPFHLVIAGGSAFTDEYARSLRTRAGGDPRILFVGEVEGRLRLELLSHCAFMVNASRTEGCPTSVIEAMMLGKRVVVADLAVNREVARTHGTYVRAEDIDDLHLKMEQEIQRTPIAREQSARMMAHAHRQYDWDRLIPRILEVYTSLLESRATMITRAGSKIM